MNEALYLDNAASAPMTGRIQNRLNELYSLKLGNSSSVHRAGVMAGVELEKARAALASRLGSKPEELRFLSGATEANNLALKGLVDGHRTATRNLVLISPLEHSSVSQVARSLANSGCEIAPIPVDQNGRIRLWELEKLISDRVLMVSVGHVNSEIGVIQDLAAIGDLCKKNHHVFFHSDGAQAFGKTPVDVKAMKLDLYSISGHKIHGPRGVGALYLSDSVELTPQSLGGGQEDGLRSGTVAVELAAAMAFAAQEFSEQALLELRHRQIELVEGLRSRFHDVRFHGDLEQRAVNQMNFALPGLLGKHAMRELDKRGIFVSVGSACDSGKKTASATLRALGLSDEQAFEALRVSWGLETSSSDIQRLLGALSEIRALP